MSTLTALYQELRAAAAATGHDQRRNLANGARLTVRVREGQDVVTFARRGAPLGETEEQTFRQYCMVPDGAERLPEVGQTTRQQGTATWHLVTYRWPVADQPMLPGLDAQTTTEATHGER